MWIVTAGWMDYGDRGTDVVVGLFDDETMANELCALAGSVYDYSMMAPIATNAVTMRAAQEFAHCRKFLPHKFHLPSCPSRVERHIPCTCGLEAAS